MIGGSSSQCCAFVSKLDEVDKHTTFNPFSGLFLWLGIGSMPGKTRRCWFAAQSWSCSPIPPIQIQSPKQKWPQIHWYRREWTSYGRTAWVASTLRPAEKDVKHSEISVHAHASLLSPLMRLQRMMIKRERWGALLEVLYLSSCFRAVDIDKGKTGDDVDREWDEEGTHHGVDGSKEWDSQCQKPDQTNNWNTGKRLE